MNGVAQEPVCGRCGHLVALHGRRGHGACRHGHHDPLAVLVAVTKACVIARYTKEQTDAALEEAKQRIARDEPCTCRRATRTQRTAQAKNTDDAR